MMERPIEERLPDASSLDLCLILEQLVVKAVGS